MNVLDQMDLANLITNTDQGERGPFLYLPVLAKYVQTKNPIWGEAIIAMLKNYHRTLQETVEEKNGSGISNGQQLLWLCIDII